MHLGKDIKEGFTCVYLCHVVTSGGALGTRSDLPPQDPTSHYEHISILLAFPLFEGFPSIIRLGGDLMPKYRPNVNL